MASSTPSAISHDERSVTDRDFLLALDPRLESLKVIRAAADQNDLAAAKAALLNYFRLRPLAQRNKARLVIRYASPEGCRARLYRDSRWLGKNPLRPGAPAPWVLDIRFSGRLLETSFAIEPGAQQ